MSSFQITSILIVNCEIVKTLVKYVKKQLFQLYCLKSFSAELLRDPQRILAKLSAIFYLFTIHTISNDLACPAS